MEDLKNLEGECRKFLNFRRSIILVKRFLFFFLKGKVSYETEKLQFSFMIETLRTGRKAVA